VDDQRGSSLSGGEAGSQSCVDSLRADDRSAAVVVFTLESSLFGTGSDAGESVSFRESSSGDGGLPKAGAVGVSSSFFLQLSAKLPRTSSIVGGGLGTILPVGDGGGGLGCGVGELWLPALESGHGFGFL
jgi:hypothetical protein